MGKSRSRYEMDDERQNFGFDFLVREAEQKLSRPLYRFFFRQTLSVTTPTDSTVVHAKKGMWKEPAIWLFLVANSFWALFCEWFFKSPFNNDAAVVALTKLVGLMWMMGLPTGAVYLREASVTDERISPSELFAWLIWLGPFIGFLGSILLWIPVIKLGFW